MLQTDRLRERPFALYDCFSKTRFGGNVGGLVFDAGDMSEADMQSVAREINAGVTGFVTSVSNDESDLNVRFFMPATEIAMCGHVTIGLFSHLAKNAGSGPRAYTMHTQSNATKIAVSVPDTGPATVMMDVSLPQPVDREVDHEAMMACLGLSPGTDRPIHPPATWEAGLRHVFVPFASFETVRGLKPDFAAMTAFLKAHDLHTLACFSLQDTRGREDYRLVVRDFCPALGVNEAPASGTTNGALCGYAVGAGIFRQGSVRVVSEQGREIGRPSVIECEIEVDAGLIRRVAVGGQAVPILTGTLTAM